MEKLLGKLLRIVEYRGEAKDRTVKVVNVRDTHVDPIHQRSWKRNEVTRSRYLITVHDTANGVYRGYYDEYVKYTTLGFIAQLKAWFAR